jgi:hypothetical protein
VARATDTEASRGGMNAGRAEAGPGRGTASDPETAPAGPVAGQPSGAPEGAADGHPSTASAPNHGAGAGVGAEARAGIRQRLRAAPRRPVLAQLLLLAGYIAAGIAVTWPMTASLANGELLRVPDVSSYVWALWWMAHQVAHLGDPWFTQYMAAPAGIQLGFDTLMPLPGLIMAPVTLLFGPAASFGVLTVAMPGLLCYVTYRAARLWLGQPGAIAAGAFFGLSTMTTWQNLYHLNISIGTLFLPLTLEAAVRLRRCPRYRQGIAAGLVLGASVLTNQESAVAAALLAAAVLVPWLIRLARREPGSAATAPRLGAPRAPRTPRILALRALALGAGVAVIVAAPQLLAMIRQVAEGGATIAPDALTQLTQSYREYGVGVPTLFAPSPRLAHFHLGQLAAAYQFHEPAEGRPTFGIVLSVLAVIGLALTWRRRSSWWLALLWLAGAVLALGPTLAIGSSTYVPLAARWHGVTVSLLMPYTWLIRVPGLSALREADRLAVLGMLGAAVLAGAALQWLCQHARPVLATAVIVVVAAGAFLEAGWSATGTPTMRATMPRVDAAIAADRSNSIVVDVPFGLRGGVGLTGFRMPPQALVMATADGHPRAVSYTSWVPQPTIDAIKRYPFYRYLYDAQNAARFPPGGAARAAARRSARHLNIEWVIVWHSRDTKGRQSVVNYLTATGFHIDYGVKTATSAVTIWRR